ncbi:HAMP domain-containing histidine kinase [Deinococcus sp. Arct2-2]|uniref:sensor histidine kinase n=1 Tax=Deinococcus sp. Arct2-2 TaxID=2568653 RepID=UPI0010A34136|nr:HAMP domain-containing sensor histidine kinase [Deinococcus sp. Arct2-2]THF68874.1 HAMP domain-containing histidine kinase [Deinococcus sp. Arct2-2]
MNIRTRLAVGAGLQTILVVLVVAALQFLALRSFLAVAEYERLEMLVPQLEQELAAQPPQAGQPPLEIQGLPRNVDVRVLQGERIVAQTPNFPPVPKSLPRGYRPSAGHDVLVATVNLNGQAATAQLASDVLGVVNPLRAYLRALMITAPAAALLVSLLSFWWAGRLLKPLSRLEAAAEQVGREGNLRARLPGAGRRDEVGRLAGVLQTSFGQLAEVRERETDFTRAAAHDLRSPLTALKTRLQGALGGPRSAAELQDEIQEALADVERMQRLTEHLLLLARGTQHIHAVPLDLAQVAGEVVDRTREQLPDVRLEFESQGNTTVWGDTALLTHLIENLIDNGVRHGQGTDMEVCVTEQGDQVSLVVQDSGPGVPPETLGRLTEAFYQLDTARSGEGHGLGLAIAHQIAGVHGSQLHFRNRQPSGLQVAVALPRSSPHLPGRTLDTPSDSFEH